MVIKFRTVALLAVLSLATTGCQKTEFVDPKVSSEQTAETFYVVYSIDGEVYQDYLCESEWDTFVERMLALAREGYEVSFSKNRSSLTSQTKEKVVFVTTSEHEAHNWSEAMTGEGYVVTITYDKITGEYTCIAIK